MVPFSNHYIIPVSITRASVISNICVIFGNFIRMCYKYCHMIVTGEMIITLGPEELIATIKS